MYLTHIDAEGNDSPAILVENSTAANRAVNLPEFVNIPPGGLLRIETPAADFYARFDRAWELSQKGDYSAAAAAWRSALELNAEDARANNNLAFALARQGKLEEAIPRWETALRANDQIPEVRTNLALALESLGVESLHKRGPDEALPRLRRAAEVDPANAGVQYNLGLALLQKARFDEAIGCFERSLRVDPDNAETHNDLAVALIPKKRFDESVWHLREAMRIDPRLVRAPSNLAWLLATSPDERVRNGAEAVTLAVKAVELSRGKDFSALDALAAAYAETGRFREAVDTARRALGLAATPMVPGITARIALYERHQPFREK
jgi:Flp pilus assembly protein TadD